MTSLNLDTAQRLISASLSIARARNAPAMTIVVLDADGSVRAAVREDRGSPAAADIAIAKARTALAFNMSSAKVGEIFGANSGAAAALAGALPGRFMPIGGAMLLMDEEGHKIGAMAASGSAPDKDAAIVDDAISAILPTPAS